MDAKTLIQTMSIQYKYTGFVFAGNLEGLSEEDGLKQPPTGGNCLNWVAGHIVRSRGMTLQVLGQECPFSNDKYERYARGSEAVTGAEGTVPLSEMLADFVATAAGLKAGLAGLNSEILAQKAPFSPGNDENETIWSLIAVLVFHESYHCGQLGVLRRMSGAEGVIK